MNYKVTYWIELSDYDFDTAQAMFDTKRYLYVGFMCHQVIENIEARYPSYKEQLIKALTCEFCQNLLIQTNELRLWIKKQLLK